jgi:hypothetical protein
MINDKWKAYAFRWFVSDWDANKATDIEAFNKLISVWADETPKTMAELEITWWEPFSSKPAWEVVDLMLDLAQTTQQTENMEN